MIVLAIDTCLAACSAAVADGERVLASASEPMERGHQERLGPLVRETMLAAGVAFDRLDRIGVTVGPGSFTGLRVGLSFAKGLGFALGRPVAGIGTLEALAASADRGGLRIVAVDAKRGQLWIQAFNEGEPLMAPDALEPGEAAARVAELWSGGAATLIGSGAGLLGEAAPGARVETLAAPDPAAVARLAQARRDPIAPPRPLYLRAPDARLPAA